MAFLNDSITSSTEISKMILKRQFFIKRLLKSLLSYNFDFLSHFALDQRFPVIFFLLPSEEIFVQHITRDFFPGEAALSYRELTPWWLSSCVLSCTAAPLRRGTLCATPTSKSPWKFLAGLNGIFQETNTHTPKTKQKGIERIAWTKYFPCLPIKRIRIM